MSVETVLAALADPTRRQVLEALAAHPAASGSALARELPISRQMVLKHLAVLQEAELVQVRAIRTRGPVPGPERTPRPDR